jgi:HK97 family phage major capsid protein
MIRKFHAAVVSLLLTAIAALLPAQLALPRLIQFSEHAFVRRGHSKVLAGGRHANPVRMFVATLATALSRAARPAVAVAVLLVLCLVSMGAPGLANAPAATPDPSQVLDRLSRTFEQFQTDLQAQLAKQDVEIRANGASSSKTAKEIEALTKQLSEVGQEMKAMTERVREVETVAARPSGGARHAAKSPGQMFIESEQYQEMRAANRNESSRFEFEGSFLSGRPVNIDSGEGSAGAIIEPFRRQGIIAPPDQNLVLRDLLNVQPLGETNSVEFVEETGFTNLAAPVKESTKAEPVDKPESDITFTRRSVPVETIAHWIRAARQVLSDARQLRAHVDGRLRFGLRAEEERQILLGNGTSPNLHGLLTNQRVQKYTMGTDKSEEQQVDAIRRAAQPGGLGRHRGAEGQRGPLPLGDRHGRRRAAALARSGGGVRRAPGRHIPDGCVLPRCHAVGPRAGGDSRQRAPREDVHPEPGCDPGRGACRARDRAARSVRRRVVPGRLLVTRKRLGPALRSRFQRGRGVWACCAD